MLLACESEQSPVYYGSVGYIEHDGKTQCSSGMRYRNVEFLVSILYYSSRGVQPRKPFVQEISRKKDRTVFQCPPYIFPYNFTHLPSKSGTCL